MTRPLDIWGANLVGAMPTNRRSLGNRMLARIVRQMRQVGRGVCLAVEADDVDLRLLDRKTFWVEHRDERNLDGVLAFGIRANTAPSRVVWLPGAPPSIVNAQRPILRLDVEVDGEWTRTLGVMHRPKPGGGAYAGGVMDRRFRDADIDLLYTDGNLTRTAMRDHFPGRQLRGKEVVWFVGDQERVSMDTVRPTDLLPCTEADDHPGLHVRARPR